MPEARKPPTRAKRMVRSARSFVKINLARLRKTVIPRGAQELVSSLDEKHIVVMRERFLHDRHSLVKLIDRIPNRRVMVEVGSLAGFSTKLFSRAFEMVFSVDPYRPGYDDLHDLNSERFRLHLARDLFSIRFLDEPNVVQHREPSREACARFEDRSLDFVYLDGSHTFRDVCTDIECWRPKIRPGGCIGGDDFNWAGVKKAVVRNFDPYDVIEGRWLARIE